MKEPSPEKVMKLLLEKVRLLNSNWACGSCRFTGTLSVISWPVPGLSGYMQRLLLVELMLSVVAAANEAPAADAIENVGNADTTHSQH